MQRKFSWFVVYGACPIICPRIKFPVSAPPLMLLLGIKILVCHEL